MSLFATADRTPYRDLRYGIRQSRQQRLVGNALLRTDQHTPRTYTSELQSTTLEREPAQRRVKVFSAAPSL